MREIVVPRSPHLTCTLCVHVCGIGHGKTGLCHPKPLMLQRTFVDQKIFVHAIESLLMYVSVHIIFMLDYVTLNISFQKIH